MRLTIAFLTLACACGGANAPASCNSPDSFDGTAGYWSQGATTGTDLSCTRVTLYPAANCVETCGQMPASGHQQLILVRCCPPQTSCGGSSPITFTSTQIAVANIVSYGGSCLNDTVNVAVSGNLTVQTAADAVQGSYDVTFGGRRLTGTFRVPAQCAIPGCGF